VQSQIQYIFGDMKKANFHLKLKMRILYAENVSLILDIPKHSIVSMVITSCLLNTPSP
jgi:hypothetical protein